MLEARLLQQIKSGDETALATLVQDYSQAVFHLALSILDDPAEAEDAVQDAFLAALGALDTYRGDSSLRTWLFAITINLCRRRLQKRKARDLLVKTLQSFFRLAGEGPTPPEETVIRREARTELWEAVAALGETHRLPIVLYYQHDMPVTEIARVLNLPQGTVLSRLYTGRERLRKKLDGKLDALLEADPHESD